MRIGERKLKGRKEDVSLTSSRYDGHSKPLLKSSREHMLTKFKEALNLQSVL
jgi:hypothetical protein